jgi:hypothetical protein
MILSSHAQPMIELATNPIEMLYQPKRANKSVALIIGAQTSIKLICTPKILNTKTVLG